MIRLLTGFALGVGSTILFWGPPLAEEFLRELHATQYVEPVPAQLHIDQMVEGVHQLAGVGPDNKAAPIKVDADGHVICSKEKL